MDTVAKKKEDFILDTAEIQSTTINQRVPFLRHVSGLQFIHQTTNSILELSGEQIIHKRITEIVVPTAKRHPPSMPSELGTALNPSTRANLIFNKTSRFGAIIKSPFYR